MLEFMKGLHYRVRTHTHARTHTNQPWHALFTANTTSIVWLTIRSQLCRLLETLPVLKTVLLAAGRFPRCTEVKGAHHTTHQSKG